MTEESRVVPRSKVGRDDRLDFWRGLCLIDMVLVHFVYAGLVFGPWLHPVLAEYLRFAAGGFVLMSGACIGAIFLPKAMDPARRRGVYISLWKRAAYILGLQYAAGASFILLDVLRGADRSLSFGQLLASILTGRAGGDLLPFYVAMLALAPALIECIRRGWSKWMLGASLAVFFAGQSHPYLLSPDIHGNFPLLLWQLVFTIGLLGGSIIRRYDALPSRTRVGITAAVWTAYGAVFCLAHGWEFGLEVPTLGLIFQKVPLTAGELLRYLTLFGGIVLATDLAWPRMRDWAAARYITRLGKYTLPIYIAHIYLQEGVMAIAGQMSWLGAGQIVLAIGAIAALGLFAKWLDRRPSKAKHTAPTRRRLLRGWAAPPAGVSAAAALLLIAALWRPIYSPPALEAFMPQDATAIDLPMDMDDLPPTDRNHDYFNDLDNDPILRATADA